MPQLLEIVGQDKALAQLERAYGSARRPHAWIFAGPEGVGRQTTAVELAKLLLCEKPASRPNKGRLADLPADFALRQACGQCNSCRTISAGTSGDFQLVTKELARFHEDSAVRDRKLQDLGIDVIRQFLIEPAYQTSHGGRGKVFIIVQAELMSTEAQNALLKTLEEPPRGVSIILLCANPEDLLPTTRSRCQLVRFGPLPAEFVAAKLQQAAVPSAEALFCAAFGQGSIGAALQAHEDGLYPFKTQLVQALAAVTIQNAMKLSEELQKQADKLAKLYIGRDKEQSKRLADLSEGKKEKPKELAATVAARRAGQELLALLTLIFRDALAVACQNQNTAEGGRATLANADQAREIAALAGRFSPESLAEILEQLGRYEELLWRNVNPKILWDNIAVTCASAAPLEIE